ncbi:UTP--glucose-1-phosphate uridylyltransferase [Candidatus Kinetoplastibacterium desouzaii TCC079E]|uniref:UTP--glucose-1-phosphate uridylyltransferase n=1 Tax=Candidatus Kinetoplastidibacterium desouzai TCC079E TaxID=1208919 RepID=M1LSH9_9PROT|nr:UTP--glucose-1-phosphate uridylyltransferase GalU [Candidatus Kinetoplastibacterium desouzaii]AGF47086.1 UTP--glucose-1-phosphate uridylyltransferase [Candidatus Kinetoplastibacterium desouzaii TCC079E]
MNHVKKAIFPVGGMGSRLLPATKTLPKEILPIINKPIIQYAVEEALKSDITELIFITGRHKRPIEDHFDTAPELELYLLNKKKFDLLNAIKSIVPKKTSCIFIRQPGPLGLGHAILSAEPVIKNEKFAVILPDDLIDADTPTIKQLINISNKVDSSVIAVEDVLLEDIQKYGIITQENEYKNQKISKIINIIEKPCIKTAPSNTAVVGRYILEPHIFKHLQKTLPGLNNEIQLTDGISSLMKEKNIFAYRYDGIRFDCGNKTGMFNANIYFGKKYHGLVPIKNEK